MKYNENQFKKFLTSQDKVYSKNTISSYLYDAKNFLKYMEGKSWSEETIEKFLMENFKTVSTFNRYLASLSKLAVFLEKPNYFTNYRREKLYKDTEVLSRDEIKKFFKSFNKSVCYDHRNYLIAVILFLHPELTAKDAALLQRSITKKDTIYLKKNKHLSPILLSKLEQNLINSYLTHHHEEIFQGTMTLFPSKKKTLMIRQSIWRIIEAKGQHLNITINPRIIQATSRELEPEEREALILNFS